LCDRGRMSQAKGAIFEGGAQEKCRGTFFVRRGALEAKCAPSKGRKGASILGSFLQVGKAKQRQSQRHSKERRAHQGKGCFVQRLAGTS
jgi:hypothetical protein